MASMAGLGSASAPAIPGRSRLSSSGLGRVRLSHVWTTAAVVIPVLVTAGTPLAAVDLAYHLRAGDIMLDTHAILRTDVFTSTAAGRPWLNQQWLAQIVLATAFRLGGWFGLIVLRALLVGLVLTFVFLACRAAGAATKRAAWLTLAGGVVLLLARFHLRPQLFGMVCFAVTAWLVARRHTHPQGVWFVIPVTLLWANLHGSFFMAPLLLGLGWVEDRWVRGRGSPTLLLAGLGSVLATMVNPYGYRVWSYAAGLTTNPVIRKMITEWRPPTIESFTGAAFFLSVVLLAALLIARVRRPVPWGSLVPLGVFLAIGLAAIVGVLAVAIFGSVIQWVPYTGRAMPEGGRLAFAPVGITRELYRILRPGELMFNAQEWGSWLEFVFPQNPVVVDSRIEVPPQSVWSQYIAVSTGVEGWQATLDSWHVDVAVLARDQQSYLIPKMKADQGWELVYDDAEGLIFRRVSTPVGVAGSADETTLRSSR